MAELDLLHQLEPGARPKPKADTHVNGHVETTPPMRADSQQDEGPTPEPISIVAVPPRRARRAAKIVLVLALGIALGVAAIPVWNYLSSYESTDDAQIDGHISAIGSRIAGTVTHVYVENTQHVVKGQKLIDIDPRDFDVAVAKAQADLAQADAGVESSQRDYQSALAHLKQSQATDEKLEHDADRFRQLFNQGVASRSQLEEAQRAASVAAASVDADRAAAASAVKAIVSRQAEVKARQAALDQAMLNRSYTTIYAPVAGVIGKKTVDVGEHVDPGQELLAVVPLDDVWVVANFKETQLRHMKPGQRVTVKVDALGRDYKGFVEGMAGASGEKYSLIPPENATGNYVKVVQRFPVRIRFLPGQDPDHLLRPGMSVEPTVWLNK